MQTWDQFPYILPVSTDTKPDVAISACLNGEAVRYDGADQTLATVSILSNAVNFINVCPEVAAGMTVPRPPIQLIQVRDCIEAVGRDDDNLNMTAALQQVAQQSLSRLPQLLSGYIFKSKSPSCGLASTPIHNQKKQIIAIGSGLQADYVSQQRPWLVFRDELQLQTEQACQKFILCCYMLRDIQQASQQWPLSAIHDHYQSVVKTMRQQRQQQLLTLLHCQPVSEYWQLFKLGLEEC